MKQRMAGELLNKHLNSIKADNSSPRDPASFFGGNGNKLHHEPGKMSHGFAEQRLI